MPQGSDTLLQEISSNPKLHATDALHTTSSKVYRPQGAASVHETSSNVYFVHEFVELHNTSSNPNLLHELAVTLSHCNSSNAN